MVWPRYRFRLYDRRKAWKLSTYARGTQNLLCFDRSNNCSEDMGRRLRR
nr:hypothetical protein [Sedimentibacter sp.]